MWHADAVRLRLVLIACALVVLAWAGVRQFDVRATEPSTGTPAAGQLSAQPAPAPAMPAVITEATTASPTTPTPLTSGWHRHLRPADTAVIVHRPPQYTAVHAARPLTFPLLI